MSARFIVAEISKNYLGDNHYSEVATGLLSERFEAAIAHNLKRGYKLHSWRLSQINDSSGFLNETIIAVFELDL